MNLCELAKALNLKVFCSKEYLDKEFEGVYVSDLLSDVLGNAKPNQIWITLQTQTTLLVFITDVP